jgi:hypothetical protein
MTTVLTVEPLAGNLVGGTMTKNFGGKVTTGNKVVAVKYPASMSATSIDEGVKALHAAITQTSGPVLVFAHSQGAQVVSRWLRRKSFVFDPDQLSFLLIGNPLRKYGGYGVGRKEFGGQTGLPTPTDSPYRVTDVSLQYDGWSDAPALPGVWAKMNAQQDRFGINGARAIHAMGYRTANLDDPKRKRHREATTEYVLLPHKPLLPFPQKWIEKSYLRPER